MLSDKYILKDKIPVPVDDLTTWGAWFEDTSNRIVKQEYVGPYFVSTVFLGLDHSWGGGPPLLFETIIFKDYKGQAQEVLDYQERYPTWELALEGHQRAVEHARSLR